MKKRTVITTVISLSLFLGCSNRIVSKTQNTTQTNKKSQTTEESVFLSKVLVGTLSLLGSKGNPETMFKAIKLAGTAPGYYVGEKLSSMQKRYKNQEEVLIGQILEVDQESTDLKTKTIDLNNKLVLLEENIKLLNNDKKLIKEKKETQKLLIKRNLKEEEKNLRVILQKNTHLSKKISFSKKKTNEYKYSDEDKKDILDSLNYLEKNSKEFNNKINDKLAQIDELIKTL